jgi:signal transduction histidine kinase
MDTQLSLQASVSIAAFAKSIRAHWYLFVFYFTMVIVSFNASAQTANDSVQIASIIKEANQQVLNHRYQDAFRIAQDAFEKSTKFDFKWGMINSLLVMGHAQKATSNYPRSLNYYLQALAEIEKRNDPRAREWVNEKLGELFQDWGVPEKALPYYRTALSLKKDNADDLIVRMAEVYLSLNQKDKSLDMYQQFLNLKREKRDTTQTIATLEKIASIYYQSNDIENSLKYQLQILEINKQFQDNRTAATLNIIGNHYNDLKKPDKALEYYQTALTLNRKTNRHGINDNSLVTNLINIGVIYQSRGDSRNAIRSFDDALAIKQRKGTAVEIAVMHNYLASLYLTQANYKEAEAHTLEAIGLLDKSNNMRMLATNHKRLSEIYGKQGNYERSLASYQKYSMLKDSLLYREQLTQEKEKQKEFLIEAAEKEAKLSLIDHEMQTLELRNQKEISEREKQQIALRLKEQEFQNVSLQNKQLEQGRAVQYLQLQQGKIEKEKQQQEILLLEQKRRADIQKNELLELERQKEIALKNTRLELQQSQLERVGIRQKLLIYVAALFLAIIVLVLVGYFIKKRDNEKLQIQYAEINRQKEQIESINESLIELNEEKNDLIGIVAHDLKSPLNQIGGMLEIIKLTTKDQSDEQKQYTTKIEESTNRLKRMVTKILDVSAIESKTLNIVLEKIDITRLLDEIVNRFAQLAEKKGISVVKMYDVGIPSITSDVGFVSESLQNLMSNAVKYSPLEKQITVKLSQRNAFVRIEFIDQGQGISEKDMKSLFGKYHKLSAKPTAGEDSTGLGLSIVKKYVIALNGRVWCESDEGKGSNFIVELPV